MTETRVLNLPHRYSYNPRLLLIAWCLGAGAGWIVLINLFSSHLNGWSLTLGLVPIAMGIVLTLRRIAFKRYLVLDREAILLPSGFLRIRTVRISYKSIKRVRQMELLGMLILQVVTEDGKFEIPAGMLPDPNSYFSLRTFLDSQAQEQTA